MSKISRSEKTVLMILAGLGALYWGYGVLLLLTVPGDYNYYNDRSKWALALVEGLIGVSIFLFFDLTIVRRWLTERRQVWPLFLGVLAGSVLFQYVFFTVFGPLY